MSTTQRDWLGILCSSICVLQCVAPLLFAVFGMSLANGALFGVEEFHVLMLTVVLTIAIWSLLPGYRRHRRRRSQLFALAGVLLLFLAIMISGAADVPLTILGGVLMIAAHALNRHDTRNDPCH